MCADWPTNNFAAFQRRNSTSTFGGLSTAMPLRWICTDAEFSWDNAFMAFKPMPGAWVRMRWAPAGAPRAHAFFGIEYL